MKKEFFKKIGAVCLMASIIGLSSGCEIIKEKMGIKKESKKEASMIVSEKKAEEI